MKALIKCAEKSEYRAWITIIAFLVIGVTGSVGQVWCLDPGGCLNLEPGPSCSRLPLDLPVSVSPAIVKEAPSSGQCPWCLDFPVFMVGLISADIRFNDAAEQLSGLADCLFPTPSDVNLASRGLFHLGSYPSLHTIPFLRTVVLII